MATERERCFARKPGFTAVLLHGTLCDRRSLEPLRAAMPEWFAGVAYSRRHHWPDPPPDTRLGASATVHEEDAATVCRRLGDPAHLIGHSYGAALALRLTVYHPTLVRSAVLVEPAASWLITGSPEARERARMEAAARAQLRRGEVASAVQLFFDWVTGSQDAAARLPPYVKRVAIENIGAWRAQLEGSPDPPVTAGQLAGVRIPCL